MVEGVHGNRTEAVFLGVGIPTLPDGGCALFDRVQPARVGLLLEEFVGYIVVTLLSEDRAEVADADKADGEVIVVRFDVVRKLFCDNCTVFFFEHFKLERDEICRLSLNVEGTVFVLIFRSPLRLDVFCKRCISLRICILSNDSSHFGEQISGVCKECGVCDALRGGNRCEPVAEALVGAEQSACDGVIFQAVDPGFHRVVVVADDLDIVVLLVDLPRDDRDCIAPAVVVVALINVEGGSDIGNRTVRTLRGSHVAEVFGVELVRVAVVGCGAREDLRVACPAHSLISLRTVGRDRDEVAELTPNNVAVELVDHIAGGVEIACGFERIAQHDAGDPLLREGLVNAGDLKVLESVEGEAGGVDLAVFITADGVGVDRFKGAQVFVVEGALHVVACAGIIVEHLAVAEADFQSGVCLGELAGQIEADNARKVLAEIVDKCIFLRLGRIGNYVESSHLLNGFAGLRFERADVFRCGNACIGPAGLVEIDLVPAGHLFGRVVFLTVEEVVVDDRAVSAVLPGVVGDDLLLAAVVIGDDKAGEQGGICAKTVGADVGDVAAVPTLAEHRAQGVAAVVDHLGHVKGLIHGAFHVVGVAGVKVILADFFAVEVHLVETCRRGVEARIGYFSFRIGFKLFAQHGGGVALNSRVVLEHDGLAAGGFADFEHAVFDSAAIEVRVGRIREIILEQNISIPVLNNDVVVFGNFSCVLVGVMTEQDFADRDDLAKIIVEHRGIAAIEVGVDHAVVHCDLHVDGLVDQFTAGVADCIGDVDLRPFAV